MTRALVLLLLLSVVPGCDGPTPASGGESNSTLLNEDVSDSPAAPTLCAPASPVACNSVVLGDTGDWNSGATSVLENYSERVGTYDGPELAYRFTAPADGDVRFRLVDPTPMETDHDVFVLEEVCASDHSVAAGFNAVDFEAREGRTYFLVVDGYDGAVGAFEAAVECEEPAPPDAPEEGSDAVGPACDWFHSTESESAPIQITGALPSSVSAHTWLAPTTWTTWVDFDGVVGHIATHEGIDWIHADEAVPVVDVSAAAAGVVAYVRTGCPESARFGHNDDARECGGGWGNHVVLDHGDGMFTRYAHLATDDVDVVVGQAVAGGERIGGMGNSGRSEQRHLHFELGARSVPFDPCAPTRSFDVVYSPASLF